MTFDLVLPLEVLKLVKKMDSKSSSGFDEIPLAVIKDNIDILATPIADIFNEYIDAGVFPDQFKVARVIPIFKKGSKTDPDNYRPISVLPVLSKIFEKIIKMRLLDHLHKYEILSSRQFGYRNYMGTRDAVNTLIGDIVGRLNGKEKVAGLFLDLSAAFDTVDHQILLKKFEHYGIRNNVLKLLSSYLQNRTQYVEIKSVSEGREVMHKSNLMPVTRGVPQGSVLGPVFFIIFLNDLTEYINSINPCSQLVIFADDTNAVISAKDIKGLEQQLNDLISAFDKWFEGNHLKLNINKTKGMLFKSTTKSKEHLTIVSASNKVEMVQSVKFLGIHIDVLLNWKQELTDIVKALSSACYAIKSLREELTINQLKTVYYALVESKLRYSVLLWGNSYNYNINSAFVMQKRAIRTMLRIDQIESCRNHFKELNILTVPCLYILVLLTNLIKNLDKYETKEQRTIRTNSRRKDLTSIAQPKLNVVQHSSAVQAVSIFNKLPVEFKDIHCVHRFKNKLRAFLLKKSYYSIEEFRSDNMSNI